MEEAEAAIILKRAMRRYSYNNLKEGSLGLFKGIEDGAVTMTMQLDGVDLKFTPYKPVDLKKYEKKIVDLEKTVEEQNQEIETLKKTEETPTETTTSLATATKSASVRKRRKT